VWLGLAAAPWYEASEQIMPLEIKPGQWVTVKVKSTPRAEAGRKTLVRLFEQDPGVKKERVRKSRSRITIKARRGGRLWNNIPARLPSVELKKDATYKVFASVPALKDLQSVEKYVEVTPA
jgi:hypothetical protein